MTLTALVVDDEPVARRRLKALLRDEPTVNVVGECGDGEEALDAIRRVAPELVFLDVQMPGLDGFEVIEALGPKACPAVIFVTAYDEYALEAFEVHAVDYLLKPFDRARLHAAIERAHALALGGDLGRRLGALVAGVAASRPLKRLLVKSGGRVYFVRVEEIDWIEATGHYLRLHVGSESHLLRATVASVEARLDPERFARIHRSTIVNVERVKEMHPAFHGDFVVTLRSGTQLDCSRTYAQRLQRSLGG